ncbi:MAG: hypothetical protein ACT4TC_21795 [Myxococcaceae bacterium]
MTRLIALALLLASSAALARAPTRKSRKARVQAQVEQRPSEDAMFGATASPPGDSSAAPSTSDQSAAGSTPAPSATDRPAEEDLFGGGGQSRQVQPAGAPKEGQGEPTREDSIMGGPAATDRFASAEAVDDPLKIGGMLYLRGNLSTQRNVDLRQSTVNLPTLVDAYMDARPSDRIRGFLLARLTYDPTLDPAASPFGSLNDTLNGTSGAASSTTGATNPSVVLDQLWLRFDFARAVFITAGKQHMKLGTSRFFNPTDFLSPQRKNPLAVFDARTGASMLKIHIPWEAKGWNFYAVGLFDNLGPANILGEIGGAARAEVVLGTAEIGIDGVLQRGRKPRVGVDFSAGIGPIDVYGEAAIRKGSQFVLYRLKGDELDPSADLLSQFEPYRATDLRLSGTLGLNFTATYNDSDLLIFGAEYFYNADGYDDFQLYPALFLNDAFQPFALGKHYGGVYLVASAPGTWDNTSFTLSVLGNISDMSYIARLNYGVRVLSFLNVEAFGAYHFGSLGGEFRLGLDQTVNVGGQIVPFKLNAPLFDLGVGLRITL